MEFWRQQTRIPDIVACLDGSHIPISRPCFSGNGYFNRKGFYSLNIQGMLLTFALVLILAAVDHKKRFVDLTIGWPGSVADDRVWQNSSLNHNIETFLNSLPAMPVATINKASETSNELVPAFILADSAYPNTLRIVTTFKKYRMRSMSYNEVL